MSVESPRIGAPEIRFAPEQKLRVKIGREVFAIAKDDAQRHLENQQCRRAHEQRPRRRYSLDPHTSMIAICDGRLPKCSFPVADASGWRLTYSHSGTFPPNLGNRMPQRVVLFGEPIGSR